MTGLRVLILSPYLPFPPTWGSGTRVFQLSQHLARSSSVTLLTYVKDGEEAYLPQLRETVDDVRVVPRPHLTRAARRLEQLTTAVSSRWPYQALQTRSPAMQQALDECLASDDFDIVQVESSVMATFDFRTKARIVVDEHNIESELLQRMQQGERTLPRRLFNRVEHAKQRRLEDRVWTSAAGCAVTSSRELPVLRARAPHTPVVVVPNGVDPSAFVTASPVTTPLTLTFVGLLTYRPNLDAAQHLVRDVLPLVRRVHPETVLTIVGGGVDSDLDALRQPGVEVTGWVPDVRPYVERAAAVVAPVRMGGGTRLKVLEALAMGKGVVSTSVGCEGIEVRDGEHVLIADTPEGFARSTCRLLADPALATSLGRAGRDLVATRYSWEQSAHRMERLHREVLDRGAGASQAPDERMRSTR